MSKINERMGRLVHSNDIIYYNYVGYNLLERSFQMEQEYASFIIVTIKYIRLVIKYHVLILSITIGT